MCWPMQAKLPSKNSWLHCRQNQDANKQQLLSHLTGKLNRTAVPHTPTPSCTVARQPSDLAAPVFGSSLRLTTAPRQAQGARHGTLL